MSSSQSERGHQFTPTLRQLHPDDFGLLDELLRCLPVHSYASFTTALLLLHVQ